MNEIPSNIPKAIDDARCKRESDALELERHANSEIIRMYMLSTSFSSGRAEENTGRM